MLNVLCFLGIVSEVATVFMFVSIMDKYAFLYGGQRTTIVSRPTYHFKLFELARLIDTALYDTEQKPCWCDIVDIS